MPRDDYNPDENADHGDYLFDAFTPEYRAMVLEDLEAGSRARDAEKAEMRRQPVPAIGDDRCRNPKCNFGDVMDDATGAVLPCPQCGGSMSRAWVSHHDAVLSRVVGIYEGAE